MRSVPLIVILDDDPIMRFSVETALRSDAMDCVSFEFPELFLDYMASQMPDCILLDMNLPGLSGTEVQHRLAEMKSIAPVIVVTGDADLPTATAAMNNGAFDFIAKPFEVSELLCKVREAMRVAPTFAQTAVA